jgi:KaiC/GvpD/RAD55 family RecA-like ATPase
MNSQVEPSLLADDTDGWPPTTELVAYDVNDFLALDIPRRKRIVGEWLLSGSATLIHAKRGVGKSQFALWLGYSIAQGKPVFGWLVKRPCKVVYLDGEMHPDELKVRTRRLRRALGKIDQRGQFRVVSALLAPGQAPDISTEAGQDVLTDLVSNADVVIVDNLSAWDGSGREDAEAWRRVQPWVWRLQKLGKAVVLIHHSGKKGTQRGTSRREDSLDVVIKLEGAMTPEGDSADGACFDLHFEKRRHFAKNAATGKRLHYRKDDQGKFAWEASELEIPRNWQERAKRLRAKGMSVTQIAQKVKRHKATVSRFLRGM